MIKQLYNLSKKFKSYEDIRRAVINEMKDDVGQRDFKFGYYEGKQSTKRWILNNEDVKQMYIIKHKCGAGEICLWIDIADDFEDLTSKKKPKEERGLTMIEQKDLTAKEVVIKLREIHKDKYDSKQLFLWARMMVNKIHESYETPPESPVFSGILPVIKKKESLTDVIAGAATAFAKAINPSSDSKNESSCSTVPPSPEKIADIRRKNLEQLKFLQQLVDDKILTETEFLEQKGIILDTLRTLASSVTVLDTSST